ncbi:MAG: hypothetical protein ACI4D4_04750 [Lachnospira sp.]
MIIRPTEFGMIQQQNSVSQIQHNAESRPAVEQQTIAGQLRKDTDVKSEQVVEKENVDNSERKFDAKDKSDNEYSKDGSSKKKRQSSDGRVFIKGQGSMDFDIKI